MQHFIEITVDDKVIVSEYKGFESVQTAIGGYAEIGGDKSFVSDKFTYRLIVFANDEGLLIKEQPFLTVNAISTFIFDNVMYGNCAILKENAEGDDAEGFTEEEAAVIAEWLEKVVKTNNNEVFFLHRVYDRKK